MKNTRIKVYTCAWSGIRGKGMATILIVEDEDEAREGLALFLSRLNYAVKTAKDGMEALKILSTENIGIVLLDIILPYLDGYEVLSVMKKNDEWAKIPVIILSAMDHPDEVSLAKGLGADEFLGKPISLETLKEKIKALLR